MWALYKIIACDCLATITHNGKMNKSCIVMQNYYVRLLWFNKNHKFEFRNVRSQVNFKEKPTYRDWPLTV